jgi:PAS domain S-box-containing protein
MPRAKRKRRVPSPTETLLTTVPVGFAVVERAGQVSWTNPAFLTLLGLGPGVVGKDLREAVRPAWPSLDLALGAALRVGPSASLRSVTNTPARRRKHSILDIEILPLGEAEDGARRLLVVASDVTERVREHERAVLFYESFLSSSNAMEVTDRNGVLVDVNPTFEKTYGYSRAECIGQKPSLVRSEGTPKEVYERMWKDLLDPARGHWSGEIMNRDRRGKERPVFLTITAVRDDAGQVTHYLGVAVDLTEQKEWERKAAHSDKLASLGQLAAGVAHEINTPLANVMLVAESVRRRTQDPWVRSRIDTITTQVDHAARIVRGLLDFARRSDLYVTTLDMGQVTRDAVAFLKGKQSAGVEVEEVYPDERLPVSGDRGQLIQVLTNILNNGYEAMEGQEQGRLLVQVRRRENYAEVEIRDYGPGIPLDALPHIFEPFFTTKPEGKGTGLGLAICHGILQAHHGSITARNAPGGGASFVVTLPLTGSPPNET